jgi:hypothetical protein
MAVRTAYRRRPSRSGDVAQRRRRARGHLRRRHLRSRSRRRSRSPRPSPNSTGSHHNRSAHPPRRPSRHRHRRALSRSGWRRRRRRIGSPPLRRDSGYPSEHLAATGCRLWARIRRLSRPRPLRRLSRRPPLRRLSRRPPIRRLSRPCSHRPPAAAATRRHRKPTIRDARRGRPRWPRNPGNPRHTPSPSSRPRSRRRGDTVALRTPAGSRLPTCWRDFRPPRREAAVAGAARSEIGSLRPSGTRNAGPERTNS